MSYTFSQEKFASNMGESISTRWQIKLIVTASQSEKTEDVS